MAAPVTIVTGADAAYFPLLEGCLRSIRDKPEGRGVALAVLDVGLTAEQRRQVDGLADRVVEPGWDFDFPGRDRMPRYFRALTARPFLPRHLPGHEIYLWIDADAWVQDWAAVALHLRAAADGALSIVPEIDRAYRHHYQAGPEFRGVIYESYRAAFGVPVAAELVNYPLLNSGVLSLAATAPHWQAWAGTLAEALRRSRDSLVEQAALNYVIHKGRLPARLLPAWCNWIVHHATPAWDEGAGCLVEPSLPHQRLGILHLTLATKRLESQPVPLAGGKGATRPMSLRYPGAGAGLATTPAG